MSISDAIYDSGIDRKERGMSQALKGNKAWRETAIAAVKALPVGWKGSGEDIRHLVAELPSHPNAWGALVAALLKDELIYPTGDYTTMKDKSSHARKTPLYERM